MATKLFGKFYRCPDSTIPWCDILVLLHKKEMKTLINKFLYFGFLALGFYQCLLMKDYMQAAASLGIGMAFDPFNVDQKWNERPQWQKIVLVTNLALVAAMFGFGLGLNDR